jgi:ActR/RegA family two-component response regulator
MTATTPSSPLLIVEDDLALQKQIKWSLDRFDCVTASDRESALVAFRRHQPAVVTMDLGLPPDPDSTSEGFKLLEQLLNADPECQGDRADGAERPGQCAAGSGHGGLRLLCEAV